MQKLSFILSAFLLLAATSHPTGDKNKAKARQLFAAYQEQQAQLPANDKIARLKIIIRLDRKFADAYAALACAHLETGTIDDRVKAIKSIEKAILLEPDNPDFRYVDGQISLQRDQHFHRTEMAKKAFEKAIALKPDYGEAHFQLGLLAEKSFLDHQNVVSIHADWQIRFSKFAIKDAIAAEQHFLKAIKYMKKPAAAYYRLALLYFEIKQYDDMLVLLKRAQRYDAANSDFRLFTGLAHYLQNDAEKARAQFEIARTHMSPAMRAVFDSVEMVLTPKAARLLRSKSISEKRTIARRHWAKGDPLYLTAVNERLLEHYSRVAYANLRFSIPHKNIPGYLTDRGKTLIRFGFPKAAIATPRALQSNMPPINAGVQQVDFGVSEIPIVESGDNTPEKIFSARNSRTANTMLRRASGNEFGARSMTSLFPGGVNMRIKSGQEVWNYGSFSIPFDRKMNGDYKFAWGVETVDGRDVFNRIIKKTPELFDPILPGIPMPLQLTTACFKGQNGQGEILIFTGMPVSWKHTSTQSGKIDLTRGLFIFDSQFNEIRKKTERKSIPLAGISASDSFIIDQRVESLPAGDFDFSMEVIDHTNKRVGVFRDKLSVPDFRTDTLQMSGVLLAKSITKSSGQDTLPLFREFFIVPAITRTFAAGTQVHVYFELYNISLQNGLTSYRIEFSLAPAKTDKNSIGSAISSLLSKIGLRNDKPEVVTVSYTFTGESSDDALNQTIDLAGQEAGEWILTVRVEDRITAETVERKLNFQIVD